jgi:hypothetical protein
MTEQEKWRDEFIQTLDHIKGAFDKVQSNAGKGRALTFPDVHKLSEGLFLSAWTHWEEFLRRLMILDLAADSGGLLRREVTHFRTNRAHERLAQALLSHPDDRRWVEWARIDEVVARADKFLSATHRYGVMSGRRSDVEKIQTIRNAIAHKSDRAWDQFKKCVRAAPFGLSADQMRGITAGRFVSSHSWSNGEVVLRHVVKILKDCARDLVL